MLNGLDYSYYITLCGMDRDKDVGQNGGADGNGVVYFVTLQISHPRDSL